MLSVLLFAGAAAGLAHLPAAEALRSESLGARAASSPINLRHPSNYQMKIEGDLELGGHLLHRGFFLMHTYGGPTAGNTALGINSLFNVTPSAPYPESGKYNTAVGYEALELLSSGHKNTAVGASALALTSEGIGNTAVGAEALGNGGTHASRNTAIGVSALRASHGDQNTATGAFAMMSNTSGFRNTAAGIYALALNTTGYRNTATGALTLVYNDEGYDNTATGASALLYNTTGSRNTATGSKSLHMNTNGSSNVASGVYALYGNSTGWANTAIGTGALSKNTTGDYNTALGRNAGSYNTSGERNIFIGHPGTNPGTASNEIRIGHVHQHRAFLSGVRGVTTGSMDALSVVIDSQGQLGTVSSSRRFKESIEDMGGVSERILDLRPVTFRYKQRPLHGDNPLRYGLIAEEVREVFPELVALDPNGQPDAVLYRLITPLLLNELQKQDRRLRAQWVLTGLLLITTLGLLGRRQRPS